MTKSYYFTLKEELYNNKNGIIKGNIISKENPTKKYPTIACCGLDCGLCPSYYIKGPSKCPGCCGTNFFEKHPSCSIITCCVKRKKFETCAECNEFPCDKIKDWDQGDSFISHRVSLSNLRKIIEQGIDEFYSQQTKRINILNELLEKFNDGRSKSFFCISTALLSIDSLEKALKDGKQKINAANIPKTEIKTKAKIIKNILNEYAAKEEILLKLRKN